MDIYLTYCFTMAEIYYWGSLTIIVELGYDVSMTYILSDTFISKPLQFFGGLFPLFVQWEDYRVL